MIKLFVIVYKTIYGRIFSLGIEYSVEYYYK